MMEARRIHLSSSLLISLFLIFGLHLVNVYAVSLQRSAVINCDEFKYIVEHPHQHNFCIQCKICPREVEGKLHNDACKTKIPNQIPGQGHAWCTGVADKSPWCAPLSVPHGRLDCTSNNDVYSKCKLICNTGYAPSHSNGTNLECLDSLHWNISDQSLLSCIRTDKPDKPVIISPGQRQEVKSGSEKTLTCLLSPDVVGRRRIYWYFKNKQLHSDTDSDSYVLHGASTDNEGEYFCQVEDEIGKSDLSSGYFLKVENQNTWWSEETRTLVYTVVGILAVVLFLGLFLCVCFFKRVAFHNQCIALWHMIRECLYPRDDELIDSCLSSVASVGGYSKTSETSRSSDSGAGEKKQSLMAEIDVKFKPAETECLLLTKQEILNANNNKCNNYSLFSPVTCSENDGGRRMVPGHNKITNMVYSETEEYSSTDQSDLTSVVKNCQRMKELKILLDQKPGSDEEKPTFQSLGRYLGHSQDEIDNHEYNCQLSGMSPTEKYIRKMTEQGQGLSDLLNFLKQFKHTQMLAESIESEMLNKHHASII